MRQRRGPAGAGGIVTVLGLLLAVLLSEPTWAASVPEGFHVAARVELGPGVEHLELRRDYLATTVHVARIGAGAPVSLRAVLSNERIAGEQPLLERTSSMCARVHCLVGVNADFANLATSEPLGGLVTDAQLVRSPSPTHHQASLTADGRLLTEGFEWSGTVALSDLGSFPIAGVNVDPGADGPVLYTAAYGPALPPGDLTGVELRTVEPAGPLRLGQTSLVEITALHEGAGSRPLPPDVAFLAGTGESAAALSRTWARITAGEVAARALVRFDTAEDIVESVGGSPILLRDGERWFTPADDNFTHGRHPRTLLGWNEAGEILLVTVDGRQRGHSLGMSLLEAADLMLALGATEAMNLDGGGSSTFVAKGRVANQPSDLAVRRGSQQVITHVARSGDTVVGHVERPVASALMVVPVTRVAVPPVDPFAGPAIGLPQALALPVPSTPDAGSAPGGTLPALVSHNPSLPITDTGELVVHAAPPFVAVPTPTTADRLRVAAVAAHAALTVSMMAAVRRFRRRPLRDG